MFVHPESSPERADAALPAGPTPALPAPDLGTLSDEALEAALCTHASHIAAAECGFVLMVAEVDRRGLWADQGARTCAHWLSWRCGLSAGVAREHIRVGRALSDLSKTRDAFARGEISYSKVRALTRIATPSMEAELLDMAALATASQLETIVSAFRRASETEGTAALERHRGRYLHIHADDDGAVWIRARLTPEDGATVLAAIEGIRQELEEESADVSAGTPDAGANVPEDRFAATCADALVAICEAHQAAGPRRAFATGPKASVVVHVDRQVLEDAAAEGCAHIEGVGVVSAHTVQRLACDAAVSTVAFLPDGTAVPEGRTRQVPDSLRRAVRTRDGGCRWPGCERRRYVDVHHVVFVSNGGRTKLTNLTTLCRAHHRMVHEGGFRLAMDRHAGVTVTSPGGTALPHRTSLPGGATPGRLAERHRSQGLAFHETTMPPGNGGRCDRGLAVQVLWQAAHEDPPPLPA
jgi:Domain of unknown function (DUF222)/HNH endonuclease